MAALGKKHPLGLLAGFLSITQIAMAITIIVVVADKLNPGEGYYQECATNPTTGQETCYEWYSTGFCLMDASSINVCRYAYGAAAIGAVISLITIFAMCIPPLATVGCSLIGAIWWLGFAITATVYGNDVSNQSWTGKDTAGATVTIPYSYPGGYWRNVVNALAWTTFACCVLAALAGLAMWNKEKKDGPVRDAADDIVGSKGEGKDDVLPAGMPPV